MGKLGNSHNVVYNNKIYKKLQTIYLILYKQRSKTAKIKSISTNVSVSLYIYAVVLAR